MLFGYFYLHITQQSETICKLKSGADEAGRRRIIMTLFNIDFIIRNVNGYLSFSYSLDSSGFKHLQTCPPHLDKMLNSYIPKVNLDKNFMKTYINAFVIILLIFFSTISAFAQKNRIYDNGYKDYHWGISVNDLSQIIPSDYKRESIDEKLISETDKTTSVKYRFLDSKNSWGYVSLKFTYDFDFLNDQLYSIELEVRSEQKKNFSFVLDLWAEFYDDIIKSYGKPSSSTYDAKSSKWQTKELNISLFQSTQHVKGTGIVMAETLWLVIKKERIQKEINNIIDSYTKKIKKQEKERNKKKIEEFKKKF